MSDESPILHGMRSSGSGDCDRLVAGRPRARLQRCEDVDMRLVRRGAIPTCRAYGTTRPARRCSDRSGRRQSGAQRRGGGRVRRGAGARPDSRSPATAAPRPTSTAPTTNTGWIRSDLQTTADRRTSLIVDPPDGRIPSAGALVAWRGSRAAAALAEVGAPLQRRPAARLPRRRPAHPLHHPDRPTRPTFRSSTTIRFRSSRVPGYVVDQRRDDPQRSGHPRWTGVRISDKTLRQWLGDSRGRWDGTTLVVETTQFQARRWCGLWRRRSQTFRIVERFARVDREHDRLHSSPSRIRGPGRDRGRR